MPIFNIGFVIFPDLTQLDFTGPLQVLSRLPQSATHIVAKSEAPVPSDCGLSLVPTHTFVNCPPLDLICVPGGNLGVVEAFSDRETIEFVRRQARTAKYVTSVCTGAFVLGVAGLLKGRRATTHWAFADLLPLVGAAHQNARVVKDGNVIAAGSPRASILRSALSPKLRARQLPGQYSSASNTTRRRHSIPVIPIRHRLLSNQRCSPRATTSPGQRTAQASIRPPGFDRARC
jgi:putative intracellular protease/amidase